MGDSKYSMLGNPMSKPGAVILAKDTEGMIQAEIDIMKTTLQANGIAVTPQIEDEISLYFKTQKEKYDREIASKGIPEKLQNLLGHTKKSKLVAYSKKITISEQELYLLVKNCSQIGYTQRSKFPEYVPLNRRLNRSDITSMMSKKSKKLPSKINAIFEERKNYMIHILESGEKWHCFYNTYKDMEPVGKNSWKHGPHLHYVSYLWPEYGKRQVWESFDKRQHNIQGVHIRLEPLPPPPPQANQEFKKLARAFLSRYK